MSNTETLSSHLGLPLSGVCRFCQCTNERACIMPEAVLGRCSWADTRLTCCTAQPCIAQATTLMVTAIDARNSDTCLCGGRKKRGSVCCWGCYGELPWAYQAHLYAQGVGIGLYYADAARYLREHTTRLQGGK